jgi:hypothetical protein
MKKLVFLIAVIFAIMLVPKSSFSQQNECIELNTPPGAICGNWVTYFKTIYLTAYGQQYGTCAIDIQYSTRVCQVINGACTTRVEQFRLHSFGWDGSDSNCSNFSQYILPGFPNYTDVDIENFSHFLGDMFKHLMDYHFSEYIAGLTPAQRLTFSCTGLAPNCTLPLCSSYEASYIAGQCQDMCINFTDPTNITATLGTCSSNPPVCCILTSKFCLCYDSLGNLVEIVANRTVTNNFGGCDGNGPLYGICIYGPGNTVVYQPCIGICPIL